MNQPLFLKPQFKERIWGGTKLHTTFGYTIPSHQTGECWGISAHSHGSCEIMNGAYQGKSLDQLWENHRDLFGNEAGERFPLLVKLLDAQDDLSVQVHPNDTYANTYENGEQGKTECWYIVDCDEGAEIVYGHRAKTRDELTQMIEEGKWNQLLCRVTVKPGDFFYVPAGTIHAIGKGIMILETQQSSDVTYRLYDYDRQDDKGDERELHIQQSIEVTQIPHRSTSLAFRRMEYEGLSSTQLVQDTYFSVYRWALDGSYRGTISKYLLCSVLEGEGTIEVASPLPTQSYSFSKGDHFILPTTIEGYTLSGNATFIVSHT